jgi:lysophospholipid acyltransferase (LPLAT)-like uncharacterized protein
MPLAQILGMPIIPMIGSPERNWIFNRWSQLISDEPFSRIFIRVDLADRTKN